MAQETGFHPPKTSNGTQPTFSCSNLAIETLEQGVKYAQSSGIALVSLLLTYISRISHLVLVFLLLTLNR